MPRITVDFGDAARRQRELAEKALVQVQDLRDTLSDLLPGEDPETGQLREDIESALSQLGDIESLIRQ
jgi:hypothetical protein